MNKKNILQLLLVILVLASILLAGGFSFAFGQITDKKFTIKDNGISNMLSGKLISFEEEESEEPAEPVGGEKTDNGEKTKPAEEKPDLTDSEYLDNSLFVGDSRVVGIQLYSGIKKMDFFCSEGLTIYDLFKEKVKINGSQMTLKQALVNGKYQRIYLEIGINEMGTGTIDDFMEAYADAAARMQKICLDADIILCGIMKVTSKRSSTDKVFNNPRIERRNSRIEKLCEKNGYHYLDINPYVCGKKGGLRTDYSEDSCHLKGKYDNIWKKCILENRIY